MVTFWVKYSVKQSVVRTKTKLNRQFRAFGIPLRRSQWNLSFLRVAVVGRD